MKQLRLLFLAAVVLMSSVVGGIPMGAETPDFGGALEAEPVLLDFTPPDTNTSPSINLDTFSWEVADTNTGYRPQGYGMHVQVYEPNRYMTMNLNVPKDGIYEISLRGFKASSGGRAGIALNGEDIGYYDFYSAENGEGPFKTLVTLYLESGVHTLTFSSLEERDGNSRHLMLTELKLENKGLEHVSLSGETNLLQVGDTLPLTLTATMADGTPVNLEQANIRFNSQDEAVSTVSSTGAVTAIGTGRTIIEGSVELDDVTRTAHYIIEVVEELEGMELANISLTADRNVIELGETVQLQLSGTMNNGATADLSEAEVIQFESSDSNIISVDDDGLALAVKAGSAQMTVTVVMSGITKIDTLTLFVPSPADKAEPALIDFTPPGTDISPELNHDTWSWEVGDTNTGFRPQSYGMHVQVYEPGRSMRIDFNVPESGLYDISFRGFKATSGGRAGIKLDGLDVGYYEFYSSVNGAGPFQSLTTMYLAQGIHTITFSSLEERDGISRHLFLTELKLVNKGLHKVEIVNEQSVIGMGDELALTLKAMLGSGLPANLDEAQMVYTSSNEEIAAVNQEGVITGIDVGRVTIEAQVTLDGVVRSAIFELHVVEELGPIQLKQIELHSVSSEIYVGKQTQLSITGMMSDGTNADLTAAQIRYESDNPDIASVDENGFVTALSEGSAELTAVVTLDGVEQRAAITLTVLVITSSKKKRTLYTEQEIANARDNIDNYQWAQAMRDEAVAKAEQHVSKGFDFWWELVLPQSIGRSAQVNAQGSPITGEKLLEEFGVRSYIIDPDEHPFKLIDPSTNGEYMYPTNDFAAYYESGLDEHGVFDPALADQNLLQNELYPELGETWGVDDGYGWMDGEDNRWLFIAHYNHQLWREHIAPALEDLRNAFLYTGDIRFAQTGVVLLDRIADVYPELDLSVYPDNEGYFNSHGGSGLGKAIGSIWETDIVKSFASAYDAFYPAFDDPVVIDYLMQRAEQYNFDNPKYSGDAIRKNIEDQIIREIYKGMRSAQIRGNVGFHQSAVAMAAVVLDEEGTSQEWIDYVLQYGEYLRAPYEITGGSMLTNLVDIVDRDGHGNETAPGYNSKWLSNYLLLADILEGYERYPEVDLYQNPKFKQMFYAIYPMIMLGNYTPQLGDSGNTGSTGLMLNVSELVLAFEKYGDPIMAQVAYDVNGYTTEGLHGNIFSENAGQIADHIQHVIDTEGTWQQESVNLAGYGFAALRDGTHEISSTPLKTYQALNLDIVEQTVPVQRFASGTVQFENSNGPGEYISFALPIEEAGSYDLYVEAFKSASYGIYDISLDGEHLMTFDFYRVSGGDAPIELIATIDVDAGMHTLTFEAVGKRQEATNYKMGINRLDLYPAGADVAGEDTRRGLWMHYGRSVLRHGHFDKLGLGIYAYGIDLAPDLGYPTNTLVNPRRTHWEINTISHNTVVVDESKQKASWVGLPTRFDATPDVQVVQVEAPKAYPQTDLYQRTTSMIRVDEEHSYAVDFFRVKGGEDHHFSFHGSQGEVKVEGLELTPQTNEAGEYIGTYAGPDIAFGEVYDDFTPAYQGSGFHFLKHVDRDQAPASKFSVDWAIEDFRQVLSEGRDIHLRLTMLGEFNEVALADGEPPRLPGNPDTLRYLIAHRSGEQLESTFTSVIEPYDGERYIERISPVTVKQDGEIGESEDVKAVKVELKNGRTDYIVSALDTEVVYTLDDKLHFQGSYGLYSEKDGSPVYSYVLDGNRIGPIVNLKIETDTARLHGTVVNFTRELSLHNELIVEMDVQETELQSLIRRFMYIDNDQVRNAAYKIEGISALSENRYTIDLGEKTLIRQYIDPTDLHGGYVYNIATDAAFVIPLSVQWKSVAAILELVERYEKEGHFAQESAARALKQHMRVVLLFETQGQHGKVDGHMQGFKALLHNMADQEWIAEQAYEQLLKEADAVLSTAG